MFAQLYIPTISANTRWIQNGTTVAGGNGQGNGFNQLHYPYGVYIDNGQTVYVADQSNDRIVEWKCGADTGQVVAGGNGRGNRSDQLSTPTSVIVDKERDSLIISDQGNQRVVRWAGQKGTKGQTIISGVNCYGLAMDSNGYLYISDYFKHEVRGWREGDTCGTVVAGGNGQGNHLDQLNGPTYIFVDKNLSVYVSEQQNHRVMKWMKDAKEGILVAGGHGRGNGLSQLSGPAGVVVDPLGTVYVAEYNNHRVMRWSQGAKQGSIVVGRNGEGRQADQLNGPTGLSFDRQGNLYVVDQNNYRVQKFNIDPSSNT